jgi:hypothetical protein
MAENKIQATSEDVVAFLNAVEHPVRRENSLEVL